jgi:hypothetical protein
MDVSFLFPRRVVSAIAGLEEAKNLAGEILRLIQIFLTKVEFRKKTRRVSSQFVASANRRFEFHKRGQLCLRSHNEPLSVAAMRVHNEDRSPFTIHR